MCRDGLRKAEMWLELNLTRDAKNNKKGFYRNVSQNRKVKESVTPPDEHDWQTGNNGMEKAEVLNSFFVSVFTDNVSSCGAKV